jgi:hypothetical protein
MECPSKGNCRLSRLQDLLGLLELAEFAFLAGEFLAYPGDFFFLLPVGRCSEVERRERWVRLDDNGDKWL